MSLKMDKEYNCDEDLKNPLLVKIVEYMSRVNDFGYYMGISNGGFYIAKHIEKIVLEDHHGKEIKEE